MNERSLLVLTKIVVLLVLFPLCQFGSEFKLRSLAQVYKINPGTRTSGTGGGSVLHIDDVWALQSFTSSLELMPELSISQSFCNNQPPSRSITINCSFVDGSSHITEIIIQNARLIGQISSLVRHLKYLRTLDLSNNKLHGSIPDELGMLSHLLLLDLSVNQLTGAIPPNLGNLKSLKWLYLNQNFLNGTIPPSLGSLSSLEVLILSFNQLWGPIPGELGDLPQLWNLGLSENGLTGSLVPQLGKLSNLQKLWLSSNNLDGTLPDDYKKLVNLEIFQLGANKFSGSIPEYITKWVNLTDLDLMGNNFEGPLPSGIFNMKSLEYLIVTDLKGPEFPFPKEANLENIYTLFLRNCNIKDQIPAYIANWNSTLRNLDLSFNKLTGRVPDEFQGLNLYRLYLTGNKLNEPFPDWTYKRVQISGDVSYNEFDYQQNKDIDFLYNHSTNPGKINIEPRNGTFPKEFMDKHCPHKKSKHYSLFINSGGEKITIGKHHYEADTSTSRFYVSETNKWAYSCNGDFFATATNSSDFVKNATCAVSLNTEESSLFANARLCPQSLTYYGFCFYNGEYNVKLHFSEIVYTEDEDHSSSGKRLFDIYSSPYINGQKKKLEKKDFDIKENAKGSMNNDPNFNFTFKVEEHLLKIELYWAGEGSLYNTPGLHGPLISAISVTPNFKVGLSPLEIAGIVIGSVLAALLLLLALSWRMGWLGDRELRVNTVKLEGKTYTLKQVKDGTRNFSLNNFIGKGRFGIVYKAVLPEQTVAVKKLSPRSEKVIDQIRTEMYTQKTLKHENIVKLLDGYSKGDVHWLIYEYMDKGSLQQALFEANSTVRLDWPTRVRICLGTAKGLMYLHEDDSSRKIIHRNIKPSNVLLDENLNAKLSDLGLAKLYDEESPYKFIQEEVTVAYMAPEYPRREAITEKVDVYSFGIILLEIVSGESNAKSEGNQETIFLLNRAFISHSKETYNDLVDKQIPNIDHHATKQAIEILKLAMKCVDPSPTLRPTMSQVVSELEQIFNTRSG